MYHLFVVLSPPPVLNCEICDLFKLWVNHSLVCMSSSFVPIHFVWFFFSFSQGFYKKKKKRNIYIWIFWKVFWGASFSLLFFLFDLWTRCWDSITTWNSRLWKQDENPGLFFPPAPRGSRVAVGCPFVSESLTVLCTLCSSLSSRRKLILVISAHALNRKQ